MTTPKADTDTQWSLITKNFIFMEGKAKFLMESNSKKKHSMEIQSQNKR